MSGRDTPSAPPPAESLAAFWDWWAAARPRVEAAFATATVADLAGEITEHLRAIDPRLEWEFAADDDAVHAFCITGAGDPEVRAVAERVVRAGPGDDAVWAFHPVRLPRPAGIEQQLLDFAGERLALGDMRFSIHIDDERHELDLAVHHPAFARLDEHQQATVAFLVIDGILGEDGVERWVGRVDLATDPPDDGLPPQALAEAADGLAARHREPTWALMSGKDRDGRPIFVLARRPLKRVDSPLFDLHAAVVLIGYETDEAGLPTTEALQRLTALEDGLAAALDGDALVAAHVTVAGRRTTHLYCDQAGPAPGLISAWSSTLGEDDVQAVVSFDLDPTWEAVSPFR